MRVMVKRIAAKRRKFPGSMGAIFVLLGALGIFLASGASYSDIRNTKHNLAQLHPEMVVKDEKDICIFCHTPEGTAGQAPGWARVSAGGGFVQYDDIGRLGRAGSRAVGSTSMACLSCHDSTQAIGVMTFSYDHPVGVPYPGTFPGFAPMSGSGAPASLTVGFPRRFDFRPAQVAMMDNRKVFWVPAPGGAVGTRLRSDLPLYARESPDGEIPYIECTSCHDPHAETRTFLRVVEGGGGICLACHDK